MLIAGRFRSVSAFSFRKASSVPSNLRYTKSHEWVSVSGDVGTVGITDHAQQLLGDVVFVELPPLDEVLEPGTTFGAVESVKAASDLYSPVAGTVIEVNEALGSSPQFVNSDPYGNGWMIKVKLATGHAVEDLLTPEAYDEQCKHE